MADEKKDVKSKVETGDEFIYVKGLKPDKANKGAGIGIGTEVVFFNDGIVAIKKEFKKDVEKAVAAGLVKIMKSETIKSKPFKID